MPVHRPRRLSFEGLESRHLLAGNVSAFLASDGSLEVRGDTRGNEIVIEGTGTAGSYLIKSGANATRINKQLSSILIPGVTKDIRVKLSGGSDEVVIQSLTVPGSLIVDLGGGTDAILLDRVTVGAAMQVNGGPGADLVDLVNTSQTSTNNAAKFNLGAGSDDLRLRDNVRLGMVNVDGGGGNDGIGVYRATFQKLYANTALGSDKVALARAFINGDATIVTGNGRDAVGINGTTIKGSLTINTGSVGYDPTGDYDKVGIGSDIDELNQFGAYLDISQQLTWSDFGLPNWLSPASLNTSLGASVDQSATIQTGAGNDLLGIQDLTVLYGTLFAAAGNGNDKLAMTDVTAFGNATIDAGGGSDVFGAAYNYFGVDLTTYMGGGSDIVYAAGNTVVRTANFQGGLGSFDLFSEDPTQYDDPTNYFGSRLIVGFERYISPDG